MYIYTFTFIAEWSVVRDIGEAKLHPFLFFSDSRDRGPSSSDFVVVNIAIAKRACEI